MSALALFLRHVPVQSTVPVLYLSVRCLRVSLRARGSSALAHRSVRATRQLVGPDHPCRRRHVPRLLHGRRRGRCR